MTEKIRNLHVLHKLAATTFFLIAVCFFLKPMPFSRIYEGYFSRVEYSYLQAGDYSMQIDYSDVPKNCDVIVETAFLVDAENHQGMTFFQSPLPEGEGITIISFHLPENAETVVVRNSLGDETDIFLKLQLQSVQLMNKDNYFLSGLCILAGMVILFLGCFVPVSKYRTPLLLVCMGLIASLPYMNDFLKWGHDINFHLARLEGIYQGMRSGQFPVLVNPFQLEGFGFLSGAMYPQLFLYPFATLRFLGVSILLCYKLMIVCMHIATALVTYYSIRQVCKSDRIGLISSILYTFAIYRLTGTYTRSSLGETLAMTFLPLLIWGVYEVLWGNYRRWYVLVLGVSAVFQSHILTTEMILPFLTLTLLCWLVKADKTDWLKRVLIGCKAVILTVLLNAFFLVPFFHYSQEPLQVYMTTNDLSLSTAYFSQMFTFFPEAGGDNKVSGNTNGEMPLTVGGIFLIGIVLFCLDFFRKQKEDRTTADNVAFLCLPFGILSLILASWLFPWKTIQGIPFMTPLVTPLQFVWRFLSPASAFLTIVSAVGIVSFAENRDHTKLIYGMVLTVLICSTGYYFDQVSLHLTDMGNLMEIAKIDEADGNYLYDDPGDNDFSRGDATIQCTNNSVVLYSDYQKNGASLSVHTSVTQYEEGARLLFPLYGYSGYEVRVNGEKVDNERQKSRVSCELPREDALIEVEYVGFPSFHVANWVSLVTLLATIAMLTWKKLSLFSNSMMSRLK